MRGGAELQMCLEQGLHEAGVMFQLEKTTEILEVLIVNLEHKLFIMNKVCG